MIYYFIFIYTVYTVYIYDIYNSTTSSRIIGEEDDVSGEMMIYIYNI